MRPLSLLKNRVRNFDGTTLRFAANSVERAEANNDRRRWHDGRTLERDVVKSYRAGAIHVHALRSVSLDVAQGEVVLRARETQGLWDQADADYQAALRIWPRNPEILLALARLNTSRGRLDEALDSYREVIQIDPALAALRHPWSTAAVSLRIRWHGVRLCLRGLPVVPRPVHSPQERVQ